MSSAERSARDHASAYLETLSPRVALATALIVEARLAKQWSDEQSAMQQRRDPRFVYRIAAGHIEHAREARALVPPKVKVTNAAIEHLRALLSGLSLDQTWLCSFTVACRALERAKQSKKHRTALKHEPYRYLPFLRVRLVDWPGAIGET
jgi:hypothetical protein